MWGRRITSVTMPSVLEHFDLKVWGEFTEEEKPRSIMIEVSPLISCDKAGPKCSYLGGKTRKKITRGLIQVTQKIL